jgi:hypothetical protein
VDGPQPEGKRRAAETEKAGPVTWTEPALKM